MNREEFLAKIREEEPDLRAIAEMLKGGAESSSIILNGVFNMAGKAMDALGQAINAASTDSPAGIAAAAGFAAITAYAIIYFTTVNPYKAVLKRARLLDLLVALGNQIGGIVKDISAFLQQPASGASGPGKPDIQLPTIGPQGGTNQCPGDANGKFCIQWTPQEWVQIFQAVAGFPTVGEAQCFTTRACRDQVLKVLQNDSSKTWYWTFTPVDK